LDSVVDLRIWVCSSIRRPARSHHRSRHAGAALRSFITSVPREVAQNLPDDLLRLMGYARGAYALGYIDDLRDPIEAVRPTGAAFGFASR
jgi:hypothetical protein